MNEDFLEQEFEADIDLTPLIDVIFMLLLFFILASTFSRPALRVALPSAATARPLERDLSPLILSITAEGILYHEDRPLTPEHLPLLLQAEPDRPVNLHVDRAAPFQPFLSVLDQLRVCGRPHVLITALPR